MKKITKVCDECGSEDVYFDAIAKWDYRKQDWVLGEDMHRPWCEQCDAEIMIEDKEDAEEEQVLKRLRSKRYMIVVEQRNVFYEEAETEQEARRIVVEDRIWDETSDQYDCDITVEEDQLG
jgi:hypothetical protein